MFNGLASVVVRLAASNLYTYFQMDMMCDSEVEQQDEVTILVCFVRMKVLDKGQHKFIIDPWPNCHIT